MDNFENTPEFQALAVAAMSKPERRMGESVIPAEAPQWSEVRTLARSLLEKNPTQLPLHIYLVQAEASINGFSGFYDAMQGLLSLLQTQWDDLSPEADLEDPDDMYYARVNLINELSEQPAFLDIIYRLPLVSLRAIGDFSTRDLDISAGTLSGTDEDQMRCQDGLIRGAFGETPPDELLTMATMLSSFVGICKSIESVFADNTGQRDALSLTPLVKRLDICRQRFYEFAEQYLPKEPVNDGTDVALDSNGAGGQRRARKSSIDGRNQVIAAFDAVLFYYQKHEPSSPVRVLTADARNFVDRSFFEVLQAMAPNDRDNLPLLLQQLSKQPLSSLLSDSYARYLSGEVLPVMQGETKNTATAPLSISTGSIPMIQDTLDSDTQFIDSPVNALEQGCQASIAPSMNDHSEGAQSAFIDINGNIPAVSQINSRQQVLEILEDIELYFMSAEPSSPIPLIVSDIRTLVPKSFIDLVDEFSRKLPADTTDSAG